MLVVKNMTIIRKGGFWHLLTTVRLVILYSNIFVFWEKELRCMNYPNNLQLLQSFGKVGIISSQIYKNTQNQNIFAEINQVHDINNQLTEYRYSIKAGPNNFQM